MGLEFRRVLFRSDREKDKKEEIPEIPEKVDEIKDINDMEDDDNVFEEIKSSDVKGQKIMRKLEQS